MGPHFTMVIVEGGPKALRRYKKLLLQRIKWNKNPDQESEDGGDEDDEEKPEVKPDPDAKENRCDLVWEVCDILSYADDPFAFWFSLANVVVG